VQKYEKLSNYLNNCDFSFPKNELWIVDNKQIKDEINKLLPNGFLPKIIQTKELISDISNLLLDKNSNIILSEFDQELLIKKILSKSDDLKKFSNIPSVITDLIFTIDNIREYPSQVDNTKESLVKKTSQKVLSLYEEECEKNNFIDDSKINQILSKMDIPAFNPFERIVIYGEFFSVSELKWQIIKNFCTANTNDIVFIGTFSNEIKTFFENNNFIDFQKEVYNYFFSDKEKSLYKKITDFDKDKVSYYRFSDWNEELSCIAREIKKDILSCKLRPDEIAIYIPERDLYSYKLEKILNDFEIEYNKTYSDKLISYPITHFFRMLLSFDLNSTKDMLTLLKSQFVKKKDFYDDFSISDNLANPSFLGDEITIIKDKIEKFTNIKFIETIILKSGIEFLNAKNNTQKLESYFERKMNYEINDNTKDKVTDDFVKSYCYLDYLNTKMNELSKIIIKKGKASDFSQFIKDIVEKLGIENNFKDFNKEKDEIFTPSYSRFRNVIDELCLSLEKIDNREYTKEEFSELLIILAETAFVIEPKPKNSSILITELPSISKVPLKKIYHVGLTNNHFPVKTKKGDFSYFNQNLKPIETRHTQLFSFVELLNKTQDETDFSYYLSYPVIIENQEDEPSEVFSDIRIECQDKILEFENKIYSNDEKNEAIGKSYFKVNEKILEKKLEATEKRINLTKWSEYEGHLSIKNTSPTSEFTSISQIEQFSACPMKYFFNYKLKLKKHIKDFKDLDSSLKGLLLHKILEEFYIQAVEKDFFKNKDLLSLESQNLMLSIASKYFKEYETALDNLYLDKLRTQIISGLANDVKRKGILYDILKIDNKRMQEDFIPSQFEYNFQFDFNELKFKGVIDRIDENNLKNSFQILDYKTGFIKSVDKKRDIKDGLSFQLPIYSEAYRNLSGKELDKAGYYLLKKENDIKIEDVLTDTFNKNKEKKESKEALIAKSLENLDKLKPRLLNSEYNYTVHDRDKVCRYCDYSAICRYNYEKSENLKEKETISECEELNLDFINADMFKFPSAENTKQETSLTEFQKEALNTDRNIVVTAGAGAGKTQVLTQRMLELIKNVNGDIEKILVITFTKKATAEMQNRIYSDLVKASENDSSSLKKAKLNFQRNWISTIDAFYMRILKENYLELGLSSEIDISDEKELMLLVNEAVEKVIDNLAKEKDSDLSNLLEIWKREILIENIDRLLNLNWIDDFINENNENLIFEKYKKVYLDTIEKHFKTLSYLKTEFNMLSRPSKITDSVNKFFEKIPMLINFYEKELNKFKNNFYDYTYIKDFDIDEKFSYPRLTQSFEEFKDFFKELKDYLVPNTNNECEISKFLFSAQFTSIEKDFLQSLFKIIRLVKKYYEKLKEERNIYTFSDISKKVYLLLKTDEKVRAKLSNKFEYIMIDEFQDTNNNQYEIAKYLSGWNGKDNNTISKNKLFFVGDEKQAIYEFRGGDVQVFNKAKDEIKKINQINNLKEDNIEFPDNFRSGKNIVEFFNSFFEKTFLPKDDNRKIYEVQSQKLIGNKEDGSINIFLFNKGERGSIEKRQNILLESKFIAQLVKKILSYNPSEEIAILFRTKKRISEFALSLEKAGIKYVIYGGTGFYENQEIVDLINILAYLGDDKRNIEFVGFLRSPMLALDDKQIFDAKENYKENYKAFLKENYPEFASKIFGNWEDGKLIKKGWKDLICEIPVYKLIERILQDTSYKASLAKEVNHKQKLKNIERFIEIAKQKENLSLEEFVEFIEFQIENKIDENSATIIELGDKKPVQLMSIHKSKGLGFDTVILADVGAESIKAHQDTLFIGEIENFTSEIDLPKEFISFELTRYDKDIQKDSFIRSMIIDLKKKKANAELKRLLYVAMTRVKRNLIISGTLSNTPEKNNKEKKDTKEKIETTMFNFIKDYFKSDCLLNIEAENYLAENLENVPFYVINKKSVITLEKELVQNEVIQLELSNKVQVIKNKLSSYTQLTKDKEKLKQIFPNYDEIKLNYNFIKNTQIKAIPYIKENLNDSKIHRGDVVHKLLEYKIDSDEHAKTFILNNLSKDLLESTLQHYKNLKIILSEELKNLDCSYNELQFNTLDFFGIYDKLVKVNNDWEIWDYKTSDLTSIEKIQDEIDKVYKIQYLIYTNELKKLLNVQNIKYKLLWSSFGIIEVSF